MSLGLTAHLLTANRPSVQLRQAEFLRSLQNPSEHRTGVVEESLFNHRVRVWYVLSLLQIKADTQTLWTSGDRRMSCVGLIHSDSLMKAVG